MGSKNEILWLNFFENFFLGMNFLWKMVLCFFTALHQKTWDRILESWSFFGIF